MILNFIGILGLIKLIQLIRYKRPTGKLLEYTIDQLYETFAMIWKKLINPHHYRMEKASKPHPVDRNTLQNHTLLIGNSEYTSKQGRHRLLCVWILDKKIK